MPSGNDAAVALAIECGKALIERDKKRNVLPKLPCYNNNNKIIDLEIQQQSEEDIVDGENELY